MGFFRQDLAPDVQKALGATAATPLIVADAFVTLESSGRRASNVIVYGVDDRFWSFHGQQPVNGVVVSPALASEVGAKEGDVLLTRLQKPSDVPIESLFGRKDEVGRTVRLILAGVLPRDRLGEFSIKPQQADVRAVFAPLSRLQRDLGVPGQANTILVAGGQRSDAGAPVGASPRRSRRPSLGRRRAARQLRSIAPTACSPSRSRRRARTAGSKLHLTPMPVFTYLANTIRKGDRQIPYSLDHRDRSRRAASPVRRRTPQPDRVPPTGGRCHRHQRMGGARARGSRRATVSTSTTTSGTRGRPDDADGAVHRVRRRADRGPCGRPAPGARLSRYHGREEPGRLGSAISGRSLARPSA